MTKSIAVALAALLVADSAPAFAAQDCAGGYKTFLGKMSKMVEGSGGDMLAEAIRKSLVAYDSCKAGDDFSPHGVWDKIAADLEAGMKK
jgi:hypothetical protein